MTQFDTWVPIDKTTSGAHSSYIQYYHKWHKVFRKVFFEPYKCIKTWRNNLCLFSPPRRYLVACMVNTFQEVQVVSMVNTCCYYKSIYHFRVQPSPGWMQPGNLQLHSLWCKHALLSWFQAPCFMFVISLDSDWLFHSFWELFQTYNNC